MRRCQRSSSSLRICLLGGLELEPGRMLPLRLGSSKRALGSPTGHIHDSPLIGGVALGGFMVATRSGLMLAALAVLVLPSAAEAYTPEGRQACTGDAFRLCIAEIPNVDRVRACLHRNKAQLSPGCRGFISPGAHRPAPGDR